MGIPNGFGTYQNSKYKYQGNFQNGKPHGFGEITDLQNNKLVYKGEFNNGLIDKQGEYYYPDGFVYKGEFSFGKKHGKGSFFISNNREIQGIWS